MKVKSYIQPYILENVTCNIFDLENEVIKIIEHQIHKNRFGELLYQYLTATGST